MSLGYAHIKEPVGETGGKAVKTVPTDMAAVMAQILLSFSATSIRNLPNSAEKFVPAESGSPVFMSNWEMP